MIEALIVLMKASISVYVGDRIYPIIAPLYAEFPFVTYEIINRDPFQTKDVHSRTLTQIDLKIYDKDPTATVSAYQSVEVITDKLIFDLNGVIENGTEYRCERVTDSYNDDIEAYNKTIELMINYI